MSRREWHCQRLEEPLLGEIERERGGREGSEREEEIIPLVAPPALRDEIDVGRIIKLPRRYNTHFIDIN